MNKIKLTGLAFVSAFLVSSVMATSVTFQANNAFVLDGAVPITQLNSSGYTAYGVWGDISGVDFSTAASTAAGLASFTSTAAFLAVPAALPDSAGVWSTAADSGSTGNIANLVIFAGADLATATSFGVISNSTFTTLALGAEAISFSGTTHVWDTSRAGTLTGSDFTLVPEPSTYAALAGLCALSFVMVRRRRA